MMKIFAPITLMLIILLIWELLIWVFVVPSYLLPSPSDIAVRIFSDWPVLVSNMRLTFIESSCGFILGAICAVAIATVFFACTPIEQALYPYMIALKSAPIVAIAPLLTVWFGNGCLPKILMAALICFFPVVVNSLRGFRSVSTEALDLFRSLSATWFQTYRLLSFPAALPFIFSALKVSATLSVIGAVVSEMTGANSGLGYMIQVASRQLDTEMIFVGVFGCSLLGWISFYFVHIAEVVVRKWQNQERSSQ